MIGRRSERDNNIFFLCGLIDYIGRITKNRRKDVVNKLGKERIAHIFNLADVYHSDNIERVADDFIRESEIEQGSFDNVKACKYSVPSYFDIGMVYGRLVRGIADTENISVEEAVIKAYNSFVSGKIDNYNCAFYYDNPDNILIYYYDGMPGA